MTIGRALGARPPDVFVSRGSATRFPSIVLAIGVISAPGRESLRREARHAWANPRMVGADVAVRFVLQECAQGRALLDEGADDVLVVRYTGGRERAAWRKQWLWFEYAVGAYPRALWLAKVEDDVLLHAPDVRRLLVRTPRFAELGRTGHALVGGVQYFSWLPALGCPISFDWHFDGAARQFRATCTQRAPNLRTSAHATAAAAAAAAAAVPRTPNATGAGGCFGPFPFPRASFAALSRPLAIALISSGARAEADDAASPFCTEARAARTLAALAQSRMLTKFRNLLAEDVWLGFALRRHLPHAPVHWHNLRPPLLLDDWGTSSYVHDATLVLHDKTAPKEKLDAVAGSNGDGGGGGGATARADARAGGVRAGAPTFDPGTRWRDGDSGDDDKRDDARWSRTRRAAAFKRYFHCPPNFTFSPANMTFAHSVKKGLDWPPRWRLTDVDAEPGAATDAGPHGRACPAEPRSAHVKFPIGHLFARGAPDGWLEEGRVR